MSDFVAGALADADGAARDAGVRIDDMSTPDQLDVLRATMEQIWGPEIVPPRNLLRGMAIGGACLLVARAREQPVGFALGWPGWHGGVHFHSHQVGVVSAHRGGGVGLALKLAQRSRCLSHGITEMRWTFDPLLLTNARFNVVRLGARVVDFLPHCYGVRRDAFNTGDTTDRVEVSWRLDRPVGGAEAEALPGDTVIAVPARYLDLRAEDPQAAAELRASVGAALSAVFTRGDEVRGLSADGYVAGPRRS